MHDLRARDSLLQKYRYEEYSDKFPQLFQTESERISAVLGDLKPTVEHFGSTAIPGVGGKGIIDIFVLVGKEDVPQASKRLVENLGYEFRPTGGDEERLFHQIEISGRRYHVHLSYFGSPNYRQSIRFRDFLRSNESLAHEYSEVKRTASELAVKEETKDAMKSVYMQTKQPVMDKIKQSMNARPDHS